MRFDLGIFDSLFGKRERLDVPMPDGSMKTVMVTKAWLKKQIAEGRMEPADPGKVHLHVCGTLGERVSSIVIGEMVSQADYDEYHDPETGGLYMIEYFEKGEKLLKLVPKPMWLKAKAALDKLA